MLMDGPSPETYPERFEALMLMAVADHQSLLNHEKREFKRGPPSDFLDMSNWRQSGAEGRSEYVMPKCE